MNNDDITIVTAFFTFKKNKYNSNDIYKIWGKNLLSYVNKNFVIFTDEENYDFIYSLRNNELLKNKTKIIKINIQDFYMYKYIEYLKNDFERDHENSFQNIDLYLIWNEKISFVKKAIDYNFFNSNYYAWCDFGCVRNNLYPYIYLTNFPNISKISKNKIYMIKTKCDFNDDDYKNPYNNRFRYLSGSISGSFFIGNKNLLLKMYDLYYNEILINYIKNNLFIGKDQILYISLYLSYPELFEIINGENDDFTIQYSQLEWFYFLKYFS